VESGFQKNARRGVSFPHERIRFAFFGLIFCESLLVRRVPKQVFEQNKSSAYTRMIKTLKEEAKAVIVQTGPSPKGGFLEVPPLLLVVESCFLDDIDCSVLLVDVPVNVLMLWESELSDIIREGLAKMNWWEKQFQQSYPTTYERLLLVGGERRSQHFNLGNAVKDIDDRARRWRNLILMMWRSDHVDRRVWKETLAAASIVHAIRVGGDEFGSDLVHQLLYKENHALPVLRTFIWGLLSGDDSETQSYFEFNNSQLVDEMFVSVKNANWKYLTVVVQDPAKQFVEEIFLFLA
jgi:hypothetical protein